MRAGRHDERPHEALGRATPASIIVPSRREMPDRDEVRYVMYNGGIRPLQEVQRYA